MQSLTLTQYHASLPEPRPALTHLYRLAKEKRVTGAYKEGGEWRIPTGAQILPPHRHPSRSTTHAVTVRNTRAWADASDPATVTIWRQHAGDTPFKFIEIHHDDRHTSNSGQRTLARQILGLLGEATTRTKETT